MSWETKPVGVREVQELQSLLSAFPPMTHRLLIAPWQQGAVHGATLQIETPYRPSAWRRFWYRVLLGWRWERIGGRS